MAKWRVATCWYVWHYEDVEADDEDQALDMGREPTPLVNGALGPSNQGKLDVGGFMDGVPSYAERIEEETERDE